MTDRSDSSPSPMLAVIGAGGGKTNLVRFLAAQQLRHRWPASIVDLRRQYGWASGLPGVDLWTMRRGRRGRPGPSR